MAKIKRNNYTGKVTQRSGYEGRIRKNLDERKVDYGYETRKLTYTKRLCPNCGCRVEVCSYTPDIILNGRLPVLVEIKGYLDSAGRSKHLLVKRDNPTEDIRFIFQRDQFIRKGSKTRYSMWAEKNGFIYAIGEHIPQEWINHATKGE